MPLLALFLTAAAADPPFPERVPGLIEACLTRAVTTGMVSEEPEKHKYICNGAPAQALWDWLEAAKLPSWEQDVPEGRWLSRQFPLGGCFKRVRGADGAAPAPGLSCTVWIPRPQPPAR